MILYHGSNVEVKKPELIPTTLSLDFGKGFYTTTNFERYRHARHMSGAAAAKFFADHGLYAYVMKYFGAFHTMAEELVFDEIDRHVARGRN